MDVLCSDKTGTLTTNRLQLHAVLPLDLSEADFKHVLGVMMHSSTSPNKTSEVIAAALAAEKVALTSEIPFSSARKWRNVCAR